MFFFLRCSKGRNAMAQTTNLPDGFTPAWIWDVSQSVGPGRINDRSDVALVQLLINRIMRSDDLRDSRKPFNQGPDNPLLGRVHGYLLLDFLEVDGWFGPETWNAINAYQTQSTLVTRDGVASPVYPLLATDVSLIQNRTIFNLNYDGFTAYGQMLSESTFPPFLRWVET
jgi:hypothetical protein